MYPIKLEKKMNDQPHSSSIKTKWALLWLEGPMQAWGVSKFYRRDTLKFPTKSGILGMVCCAMGAGGPQEGFLSQFKNLKQTVHAFETFQGSKTLTDFQIIGGGYNQKDPWENLFLPKKSDGTKPTSSGTSSGTKITIRQYLQDTVFAVCLEIPEPLAMDIEKSFKNPVWGIFLGRKNCTPTDFVFRGIFDNYKETKEKIKSIARQKGLLKKETFIALDWNQEEEFDDVLTLEDVPVRFGDKKIYESRRVGIQWVTDFS